MQGFQLPMGHGNGMIVSPAFGISEFPFGCAQCLVAVKHIVHRGLFQGRDFLRHHGQTPVGGAVQMTAVALQVTHDKLEQ